MELGVHFNTVAEAYSQLAAEGWLDLKHGRTAVVLPRAISALKNGGPTWDFRDRLRGMLAQIRSQCISAGRIVAELGDMAKAIMCCSHFHGSGNVLPYRS